MKKIQVVTTLAVASVMVVGAGVLGPVASGASTLSAPTANHVRSVRGMPPDARRTLRTVGDEKFKVTRCITSRAGTTTVSFYATDRRTGRTVRLN